MANYLSISELRILICLLVVCAERKHVANVISDLVAVDTTQLI